MLIQINEKHVINPDHITQIRIVGDTLKIYFTTGHFDDIKISIDEFMQKIEQAQSKADDLRAVDDSLPFQI